MKILQELYPEIAAGGFSRADGTVSFYSRVRALLTPESTVLDFGAGRGVGITEDPVQYRRDLRNLQGQCARVIGVDVDDAVRDNPSIDEYRVIRLGERLPFSNESINIVVSDATFEHISDPEFVCKELIRVLMPGGWICARTPNRWGYIGIAANAVPNRWHVAWLRHLQPERKAVDVFPTTIA